MADGAYDEDLTPEEEAQLQQEEGAATAAPAREAPAEEAKEPATPAPPPPPPPAPAPTDEEEYQAFLKKHEGKTPEEIARLAYQQTKRASRGEFEARRAGETLDSFQKRLASDRSRTARPAAPRWPSAAVRSRSSSSRTRTERSSSRSTATSSAKRPRSTATKTMRGWTRRSRWLAGHPRLPTRSRPTSSFGTEMGYSKEELGAIRDGREILTLYCARNFANLFKAGNRRPAGQPAPGPGAGRQHRSAPHAAGRRLDAQLGARPHPGRRQEHRAAHRRGDEHERGRFREAARRRGGAAAPCRPGRVRQLESSPGKPAGTPGR
jgi:hypothetical protein